MFGKEKATMAFNNTGNTTTLIAKGTEIVGDIKFTGNLEIEGKVRGNIIVASSTGDASVRVLEHGEVQGDIDVPSIVINGSVSGDVHSSSHIELAARAKVHGNVHYNLIEMVKGAQVNGNLVYNGQEAKETSVMKATELGSEDFASEDFAAESNAKQEPTFGAADSKPEALHAGGAAK